MNFWQSFQLFLVLVFFAKASSFLFSNITSSPSANNGGSSNLVYLMQQVIDLQTKFENQAVEIQDQGVQIQNLVAKVQTLESEKRDFTSLQNEVSQLKLQGQNILKEYKQLTNSTSIEDITLRLKNMETSIRYFSLSLNDHQSEILNNNKTLQNQIATLESLENSKIQKIESELSSLKTQNLTSRVHDLEHGHVIPGRIRLVNGSTAWMGRVEVSYKGTWATVSDYSYFDDDDAKVVCRMLGLPWEWAVAMPNAYFGRGSGAIAYDLKGLNCTGQEQSIYDCNRHKATVGQSSNQERYYLHMYDVGVICLSVRLVDGSSQSSGRVELNLGGLWGTVCDDSWDDADASVVCRMLGYRGSARAFTGISGITGTGVIWMDDVACTGSETSIVKCKMSHSYQKQFGYSNCDHATEDARVVCS